MFKRRRLGWLYSILLVGLTPLLFAQSSAADSNGLNVQLSPVPIELNTTPGSSITTPLRLRNSGAQDETLKLSLEKVSQTGENGQISLADFNPTDPLPGWVQFSKNNFIAPAGQWQTINLTINVPKSAAYGYYFAVQIQLANPPKARPGQTAIQGAADVFVLLNAEAPGEQPKIEVSNFGAEHSFYEFLPVSFFVRLHNAGNIHVAPHGNIFINQGSHMIGSLNVNSTLGNILPGSNRLFNASWNDGFPVYTPTLDVNGQTISNGKGGLKQHLVWNFSQVPKFRFGHYSAHLIMVYNDGQRDVPISATVGFWVFPWRLLAVLLVIVLLLLAGLGSIISRLRRLRRRKNHHHINR